MGQSTEPFVFTMSQDSPAPPANLNDFGWPAILTTYLGAGNLINWLLHGVLTVQIYLYYLAFPNDKAWIKTVIYTVYFLETAQVIGLGILFLILLTAGPSDPIFGDVALFTFSFKPAGPALPLYDPQYESWLWYILSSEIGWSIQALLIDVVGGLVPLIAQCIYAHRIWIITQRKVMPWLIIALAILQLFVAILTGTGEVPVVNVALCWTGLNMVNDSIIAFIMVRSLSKEKPLSNNTQSKIVRLVRLIIATGSLTVTANFCCFVIFTLLSVSASTISGWTGVPILIFMPKLYANSMLVMLNNRMTIRKSRYSMKNDTTSTNVVSMLVIGSNPNGLSESDSATSRGEVSAV